MRCYGQPAAATAEFPVHDRVGLFAIPDHDAAAIGADTDRHPDTVEVGDDDD